MERVRETHLRVRANNKLFKQIEKLAAREGFRGPPFRGQLLELGLRTWEQLNAGAVDEQTE